MMSIASRRPRRALVAALFLSAAALACGDDASAPNAAPFHVDLLAGTWTSAASCPFQGVTYDFAFSAPDSASVDSVTGRLQSRACTAYTADFPAITGRVSRAGTVTIESEPVCCATPQDDYRFRFTGRFVDSATVRGTIARWLGDTRLDAPVALTLTRQPATR